MNDDIYIVLPVGMSGAAEVWATSQTESYETARRSVDGTAFVAKYTNLTDVPQSLIGYPLFNYASVMAYMLVNASQWYEEEEP